MIERFLPFPSICQEAAVTRGFSIFADIFFIKHICLWSKDAYSYFPQSTAGQATAESSEIGRRGPGSALEGPEAAAARFADSRGDGVLMSSPREAAPRRRVPFLPPAPAPPSHFLHLPTHLRLLLHLRLYKEPLFDLSSSRLRGKPERFPFPPGLQP